MPSNLQCEASDLSAMARRLLSPLHGCFSVCVPVHSGMVWLGLIHLFPPYQTPDTILETHRHPRADSDAVPVTSGLQAGLQGLGIQAQGSLSSTAGDRYRFAVTAR